MLEETPRIERIDIPQLGHPAPATASSDVPPDENLSCP